MKTQAAILVDTGKPIEIGTLEIPKLKKGQVIVEIAYSGVCHTQILEARGRRGPDKFLPHCLGHEGSGTVAEIGEGVTKVRVGDQVVLSWIKGSGLDAGGTVYTWEGRPVNAGPITTFARHSVISENRLTVLGAGVPLNEAAFLGCAVPTGQGSVMNAAGAKAGQSVAVFGVGGIGLCAIAGAAALGCAPVIAVDPLEERLARAKEMGATHTVKSGPDAVDALKKICSGGLDIAIEASGRPPVMVQALACVRSQGGIAVVIGNAPHGEMLTLDPREFNQGKQLRGTWGGDNVPDRDFPRYASLVSSGKLRLSPLLSRPFALEAINEALESLERGVSVRPLVEMAAGAAR